jgi:hypothetical protein
MRRDEVRGCTGNQTTKGVGLKSKDQPHCILAEQFVRSQYGHNPGRGMRKCNSTTAKKLEGGLKQERAQVQVGWRKIPVSVDVVINAQQALGRNPPAEVTGIGSLEVANGSSRWPHAGA